MYYLIIYFIHFCSLNNFSRTFGNIRYLSDQLKIRIKSNIPNIHRFIENYFALTLLKAIRYYSNLTYNIIFFFIYTIVRMVISLINKPP